MRVKPSTRMSPAFPPFAGLYRHDRPRTPESTNSTLRPRGANATTQRSDISVRRPSEKTGSRAAAYVSMSSFVAKISDRPSQ